jgi:hypothetical protein
VTDVYCEKTNAELIVQGCHPADCDPWCPGPTKAPDGMPIPDDFDEWEPWHRAAWLSDHGVVIFRNPGALCRLIATVVLLGLAVAWVAW